MSVKFKLFVFFGILGLSGAVLGANTTFARETEIRTDGATSIEGVGATLNGFVDSNDDRDISAWFEWGTSSSRYDNQTELFFFDRTSGEDFEYDLHNLRPDTTYYFRAVAENDDGDVFYGDRKSFKTDQDQYNDNYYYDYNQDYYYNDYNLSIPQPRATTYAATVPSDTYAVLNGYVDTKELNTIRWFEWGTNANYLPNSTIKLSQGSVSGNFNQTLSGLVPNTTYYFRAGAQSSGNPVYGSTLAFTTKRTSTPVYYPPDVTPITVPVNVTTNTTVPTITIPVKINPIVTTPPMVSAPMANPTPPVVTTPPATATPEKSNNVTSPLAGAALLFGGDFFPQTLIGWVFLLLLVATLIFVVREAFVGPRQAPIVTDTHE